VMLRVDRDDGSECSGVNRDDRSESNGVCSGSRSMINRICPPRSLQTRSALEVLIGNSLQVWYLSADRIGDLPALRFSLDDNLRLNLSC